VRAGTPDGPAVTWDSLRLRSALPELYQLGPPRAESRPPAVAVPTCVVCRGPVRPGYARCYQCERHDVLGHGLLADAVVPVSYAVKGTDLAEALWRYKSCSAPGGPARRCLLALLLTFLNDHGSCIWRDAAMPPPDRLAVVPTGYGRPGPHPLLRLASPYLRLPLAPLAIRPGRQGRDLDVHRFRAGLVPAGGGVLLLDDSWVSGASAQSASAALKLAGAGRVAIVVLGRHLSPADPRAGPLIARLTPAPYDPSACAVHAPGLPAARTGQGRQINGANGHYRTGS
jgi:hypothetical protein